MKAISERLRELVDCGCLGDRLSAIDEAADTIDALVAALDAMQKFYEPMRFDRASDNARSGELDKMALAALALARGDTK